MQSTSTGTIFLATGGLALAVAAGLLLLPSVDRGIAIVASV